MNFGFEFQQLQSDRDIPELFLQTQLFCYSVLQGRGGGSACLPDLPLGKCQDLLALRQVSVRSIFSWWKYLASSAQGSILQQPLGTSEQHVPSAGPRIHNGFRWHLKRSKSVLMSKSLPLTCYKWAIKVRGKSEKGTICIWFRWMFRYFSFLTSPVEVSLWPLTPLYQFSPQYHCSWHSHPSHTSSWFLWGYPENQETRWRTTKQMPHFH